MATDSIDSSYRDPSGFLFLKEGVLYRQVNQSYRYHYDACVNLGLYKDLTAKGWLIAHKEVPVEDYKATAEAYRVLKPELIPFISYPYEWSFSQLKDAALLTLRLAISGLEYNMILKDASAFNIQFIGTRPILIDTLSFEIYKEKQPWVAYRQFCEQFLAPLSIASYIDQRLLTLSKVYLDGIPLDLVPQMLPFKARFNFGLMTHLYLHVGQQKKHADSPTPTTNPAKMSKQSLLALLENLKNTVSGLKTVDKKTQWSHYYEDTNYSSKAMKEKEQVVASFLKIIKPKLIWDMGANTGHFSNIASQFASYVVAFDFDTGTVARMYDMCLAEKKDNILPLVIDIANPSANIGFAYRERSGLIERGLSDCALALALIHHLAIGHNLPFSHLAGFFAQITKSLIIEFVPKDDSQVQRLLASREDIFDAYHEKAFEEAFSKYFTIEKKQLIAGSKRSVYLMKNKNTYSSSLKNS